MIHLADGRNTVEAYASLHFLPQFASLCRHEHEPYEVPSAYRLPNRMTEYYAFLGSWECAFMLI